MFPGRYVPGQREEPGLHLRCRDVAYYISLVPFACIPLLVMIMPVLAVALCAWVELVPRLVVPVVGALLRQLVVLGISAGLPLRNRMVANVAGV